MNTLPEISECVPFPTFDDVEWKGKVVEFSPDIYSEIPQSVNASELSAVNRNRYTSFGLIDNVVVYVTKGSSFQLGQWMIGCLLQKRYPFYTVEFGEKSEGLSRLRLETEEEWNVETSLNKFTWNPKSSEGLIFDTRLQQNRRMGARVTNVEDEWFTNEQFFARDTLAGFSGIEGSLFAAEFFLNFGTNKEQINYDVLHHIGEPPFIAFDWSCELRVQLAAE